MRNKSYSIESFKVAGRQDCGTSQGTEVTAQTTVKLNL